MRCAEQREPGQGAQPAAGGLQPEPGPEPPAQPPLHQAAQPRLRDRGEVELLVAGEPEAAQLPDVAVELALPAVAVGEIGHLAAGVDQQCAQVGVARRRAADPGPPVVLGPVQQRHRAGGGQGPHHRHDHRGEGLGGPLVVAALQHVLDLQTQLRAQQVQPDDLLRGDRDLARTGGRTPRSSGRPLTFQVLAWAWQSGNAACGHRSQCSTAQTAPGRRCLDRRRVGQPPVQLGSPGAVPPLPVQLTHPAARGPVAAPGHPTAGVRALPVPPKIGRRGEHRPGPGGPRRPSAGDGPGTCPCCERPGVQLSHPAGAAAEHRVLRGEHEHLGPELGPDRTQQLLQQRRAPRDRRPGRRPHSCTALPVVGEPARLLQALAGVFDAEVPVDLDRGGHRGVPEQPAHHLHRGARAQQPGGVGVTAPVRIEVDPGPSPQPADQVIDRGVGQRAAVLPGPEIDEHVVAVQLAVLAVQIVGVEPDQPGADRDRPWLHRLGAGAVVVDPRHHRDRALGRRPVLVAQPQRLPDPHPGVVQHREQQPVPQPVAAVQDRLHLGGGQDPRVLASAPSTRSPAAPPAGTC